MELQEIYCERCGDPQDIYTDQDGDVFICDDCRDTLRAELQEDLHD